MEHVELFGSHDFYAPDDAHEEEEEEDDEKAAELLVAELLVNNVAQLDNLLLMLLSMKSNLNTMKVDMIGLKKILKSFESFLKVYMKSATTYSSSRV